MGLLSRFFEDKGIPTGSIYLQEGMTRAIPSPRMLLLRWPFGHPYGEPDNNGLQAMVLRKLLETAGAAEQFGDLVEPDWSWRRTDVELPDPWKDALNL